MKPVLAIMQNQWFKDPERVKAFLDNLVSTHGQPARRRFIARALFSGCMSGRRIQTAFSTALLDQMTWDESSTEISGEASYKPKPDAEHVARVIKEVQPRIILAFGQVAKQAAIATWKGPLILSPHPTSRNGNTLEGLRQAAAMLQIRLNS